MSRRLLGLAALCCLLVMLGHAAADQGERSDNAETIRAGQLRGTWVAVSRVFNGQKEEAPKDRELIFTYEGVKVTVVEGKHTEECSCMTRDSKTPKEMDIITSENQGKQTIKCIYQVEGDTLKLAFNHRGVRPTNFDAKDNESTVITFKRKK